MTRTLSFSSLTIPDLLELPKLTSHRWKRKLQLQQYPLKSGPTPSSSFISSIDIFHTTWIHPVLLLASKVFIFSIIYHLVEEKTSKTIQGFNYSWYITFFELCCAFLLECLERVSIAYNTIDMTETNLTILDEEAQSLIPSNDNTMEHTAPSPRSTSNMCILKRLYRSIVTVLSMRGIFHCSYILLSLNLIFSRGLGTIVLQYYDMDYPTYAICRNSKMVFVMFLSVVWLKKSYHCAHWVLVLLTTLSVLCFRLASHDLGWFSSANTMGVPLLLLSTFLSAMDNSWKERVTTGIQGISPNEILYNINLVAVSILFIYLTIFSNEYMEATTFLLYNPSVMLWMILRGISYVLWIHFSVVLIAKAGALINQYVSASRKLFSVILSFIMFGRPFAFMHGVGFAFFMFACMIKIYMVQHKDNPMHLDDTRKYSDEKDNASATSSKSSDTDEDGERDFVCDEDELRSFIIPIVNTNTVQKRKEHNNTNYMENGIEDSTDFEERKYIQ
eukprot:305146_1